MRLKMKPSKITIQYSIQKDLYASIMNTFGYDITRLVEEDVWAEVESFDRQVVILTNENIVYETH